MREGERGANRRCGPVRPPDGATSQRRVDDHYPLHLSPFPPAAQPNIDRGYMHGAGCFACRSGGGGEMRRRRLATPLNAARERPAPLCTTARPSVLGDWSRNLCLCSLHARVTSLSAGFLSKRVRPCVGRGAHGGTVDLPQPLLSLTPSSCPHLPHPQVFSVSHQGLRLRCDVAKKIASFNHIVESSQGRRGMRATGRRKPLGALASFATIDFITLNF